MLHYDCAALMIDEDFHYDHYYTDDCGFDDWLMMVDAEEDTIFVANDNVVAVDPSHCDSCEHQIHRAFCLLLYVYAIAYNVHPDLTNTAELIVVAPFVPNRSCGL